MNVVRQTSVAALSSITAVRRRKIRRQLFEYMLKRGSQGATLNEMSQDLGILLQTMCGQRVYLEKLGLLHDSGTRRKNTTGRTAIVWVVPPRVASVAQRLGTFE